MQPSFLCHLNFFHQPCKDKGSITKRLTFASAKTKIMRIQSKKTMVYAMRQPHHVIRNKNPLFGSSSAQENTAKFDSFNKNWPTSNLKEPAFNFIGKVMPWWYLFREGSTAATPFPSFEPEFFSIKDLISIFCWFVFISWSSGCKMGVKFYQFLMFVMGN